MSVNLRKKRSPIWDHFTQIEDKKVKCLYCSQTLVQTVGSNSNLNRHMIRKHPTIPIVVGRQVSDTNTGLDSAREPTSPIPGSSTSSIIPQVSALPPSTTTKPPIITDYFQSKRPLSARRSEEFDKQLLRVIAKGYLPFSTVEEAEFKKFIQLLNPTYNLPTRKTLSNSLLTRYYEEVHKKVEEHVEKADAVCITTDSWTSLNNDSFIAVTAHYLDERTQLKSFLLDCVQYSASHTADNIAQFLSNVFRNWKIHHKIAAIVTDNASNVLAAVKAGNWRSIGCFAHKVNLLIQDSLGAKNSTPIPNTIGETIAKVKNIVQFFKKSGPAKTKLSEMQKNMGYPELKLKQDCPTRWNSTYEMLSRILRTKAPLITTVALLRSDLALSNHDWEVIELAVPILETFFDVTTEVCGEKYITLSKVTLYVRIMREQINKHEELLPQNVPISIVQLIDDIKTGLDTRFRGIESEVLYSESTLLDPRFKKKGFKYQHNCDRAIDRIKSKIIRNEVTSTTQTKPPSNPDLQPSSKSLWDVFDAEIANLVPENPTAAGIREIDRYLQEDYLPRCKDPLQWWEERKTIYPLLYGYMKKRLCLAATSVPCERIFSKAGQIMIEKRSRLTCTKLSQLLFLNYNM